MPNTHPARSVTFTEINTTYLRLSRTPQLSDKYEERSQATGYILNWKRTHSRHVRAEEKLDKIGATLETSKKPLVRFAQWSGFLPSSVIGATNLKHFDPQHTSDSGTVQYRSRLQTEFYATRLPGLRFVIMSHPTCYDYRSACL